MGAGDKKNVTRVSVSIPGVSFPTILFVVFLVLRLTGTIDWSWWWVTAPLWIPFGVLGAVVTVFLVLALVAWTFYR